MLSTVTVTAVGLTCKAFLNLGFCSITVNGLPTLLSALESDQRTVGQGVVTVSNHISTLDDPITWGILPARYFLNSRTTRWILGASDIMFTNPVLSAFFRQGQVLETFRGEGIYQHAVDVAIKKLDQGSWVHLYGEGKVNPPTTYLRGAGIASLPRFKWGVGRIVMETAVPPIIIPMWLTGFDKLMPLGRHFPYNYCPRLGVHLSITFGNPIPSEEIMKVLQVFSSSHHIPEIPSDSEVIGRDERTSGWIGKEVARKLHGGVVDEETRKRKNLEVMKIRSDITAVIQRGVETLGRSISGELLQGNTTKPDR